MYPDLEIARNRIAELHHQAQLADLAIAIRRARRARGDRSGHAGPARTAGPGKHAERPRLHAAPTAPGTPKSAPQGRRTPKHQLPRRTAAIAPGRVKSAGRREGALGPLA